MNKREQFLVRSRKGTREKSSKTAKERRERKKDCE